MGRRRTQGVFIGSNSGTQQCRNPLDSSDTFQNAFADRLGRTFPLARMFAPDFMHEFELGVWKSLFTHLVRVLYAACPDGSAVQKLDARFRQISTFGLSTIRGFASNASEMKKLAARDFEDILQVRTLTMSFTLTGPPLNSSVQCL